MWFLQNVNLLHRYTRCLVVIMGSRLFHLVCVFDKNLLDKSPEIAGAQCVFNIVRVYI